MGRPKKVEKLADETELDHLTFIAPAEKVATIKDEQVVENTNPFYQDVGWSDFVLSLLADDEKDVNGNPRVIGLRRIAETLLGDIVFSGPISYTGSGSSMEAGRAAVLYEVEFEWRIAKRGDYIPLDGDLQRRKFRAVASCSELNMPENKFNVHPEAIAETRAEARCFKKALGLKCVTAEELGLSEYVASSEKASSPQKILIKTKCTALGLNLTTFLNGKDLEAISKDEALSYIEKLDDVQRQKG